MMVSSLDTFPFLFIGSSKAHSITNLLAKNKRMYCVRINGHLRDSGERRFFIEKIKVRNDERIKILETK
jgi:hypothetical protein